MTESHDGPQRIDTDHAHAAEQDTLGATLERARLTHRARRVEMVLAQLGERRREQTGPTPTGLDQAIDGFSTELTHVHAQLAASRILHAALPRDDIRLESVTR